MNREQFPTEYLSDGVYATFDGFHFWLDCRAQPGLAIGPSETPSIALEPQVLKALNEFAGRCIEQATARIAQ